MSAYMTEQTVWNFTSSLNNTTINNSFVTGAFIASLNGKTVTPDATSY